MKIHLKFCALSIFALCGFALSGCDTILPPPEPAPVPPKATLPTEEVFSPTDYITHGKLLDGPRRVLSVQSGKFVTIQAVTKSGNATPELVRLAGIMAPEKGQPGYELSVQTVHNWVDGKNDLVVEGDEFFPYDLEGHRMVQIYFTPTKGENAGKQLNLNRMMVRSGYAAVDLNQATSIDLQLWLNDETYARLHTKPDPKTKDQKDKDGNPLPGIPAPLGLWGWGIYLGQRPTPVPRAVAPGGTSGATPGGSGSAPKLVNGTPQGSVIAKTTTTTTTTTTTSNP